MNKRLSSTYTLLLGISSTLHLKRYITHNTYTEVYVSITVSKLVHSHIYLAPLRVIRSLLISPVIPARYTEIERRDAKRGRALISRRRARRFLFENRYVHALTAHHCPRLISV